MESKGGANDRGVRFERRSRTGDAVAGGCLLAIFWPCVVYAVEFLVTGGLSRALHPGADDAESFALFGHLAAIAATLALAAVVVGHSVPRRGRAVVVSDDATTVVRARGDLVLPHAALASLEVRTVGGGPFDRIESLALRGEAGDRVVFDAKDWALAEMRAAIVAPASQAIERRLRGAIERGERVLFREPKAWALGQVAVGGLAAAMGLALLVAAVATLSAPAGLGAAVLLVGAVRLITRALRVGRGLELSSSGAREIGSVDEVPWSGIRGVAVDAAGLTLEAGATRPLRLSPLGENFVVLPALLRSLAPATATS